MSQQLVQSVSPAKPTRVTTGTHPPAQQPLLLISALTHHFERDSTSESNSLSEAFPGASVLFFRPHQQYQAEKEESEAVKPEIFVTVTSSLTCPSEAGNRDKSMFPTHSGWSF